MKRIMLLGVMLLLFILLFVYPCNSVSGATNSTSEIDIGISPSEFLFDIKNMKPGDWAPRTIVIQNKGLKEFKYLTTLQNDDGSKKLFNELLLEISDANGEIYNGKLADFKELSPRNLAPSSEEELNFTIRFPEKLGNEFQGKSAIFSLIFTAEGNNNTDQESSGGIIGGDDDFRDGGSELPDTATNMFTYLLIGGALVVTGGILLLLYRIRQIDNKRI